VIGYITGNTDDFDKHERATKWVVEQGSAEGSLGGGKSCATLVTLRLPPPVSVVDGETGAGAEGGISAPVQVVVAVMDSDTNNTADPSPLLRALNYRLTNGITNGVASSLDNSSKLPTWRPTSSGSTTNGDTSTAEATDTQLPQRYAVAQVTLCGQGELGPAFATSGPLAEPHPAAFTQNALAAFSGSSIVGLHAAGLASAIASVIRRPEVRVRFIHHSNVTNTSLLLLHEP
jgi:hypothetical protein